MSSSSNSSAGGDNGSFLIQLIEAVSAISVPLGGGVGLYAKWRRSAERDRRAREEAARIASERAAHVAREEEQKLRDDLMEERDKRIKSLQKQIEMLTAENSQLQKLIDRILRGHDNEQQ